MHETAIGATSYADPVLSANIYCSGHLDHLIFKAVAPFWHRFKKEDTEDRYHLWMVRYARRGEHLKIRIHGPEENCNAMRQLLEDSVGSFLSELSSSESANASEQKTRRDAPPIDTEDYAEANYPDRNLLWTHYQRSPVSLAGKPFILDDEYVERFTSSLACACKLVLSMFGEEEFQFSDRTRQTTLLKALVAGLSELGLDAEARASYLTYHRDWLLRFLQAKSNSDLLRAGDNAEVISRFDSRLQGMASSLDSVRAIALRHWGNSCGASNVWRGSLGRLLLHVRKFQDDPDYRLDPFASDPAFAPVFKVFHGLANQAGLNMVEEAFVHHLLLTAISGPINGES